MNTATNLIRVVRALVEQMTPVISIDSTTDNGDGTYTLETCGTYWVTEQLVISIDGVSFTVQSFTKDTEIIVSGPSLPAVNFFQLDAPRFRPGTHRKVNEEMGKKDKTVVPFVYLPISTITEQTEYDAELAYIADINPFFVVPYDFKKDETDQHQTLFIEPAGSMADYFLNLVLDQEDKFNRPDQTNRKEWQNFGESTRWGFTDDIFDANVSAVSLDFELNVQRDWACECETPSGDSCLPVTIYQDGTFETSVASGGRFDYSTAGANAGNTMNGTTLTPIVGGTTKAFTIRYEDDSPVTVTTVSDSATEFIGEITNPPSAPVIAPFRPPLLDQTVAISTYDENWHKDNGTFDFTYTSNSKVQMFNINDPDKILFDDSSVTGITQHLFRFVGVNGGYYDRSDGNYYTIDGVLSTRDAEFKNGAGANDWYIIDRYTWLGWYGVRGGQRTHAGQLSVLPVSATGFTDFYLPTMGISKTITNRNDNAQILYLTERPPFDIQLDSWLCTYYNNLSTNAWWVATDGEYRFSAATGQRVARYVRVHNWGTDDNI